MSVTHELSGNVVGQSESTRTCPTCRGDGRLPLTRNQKVVLDAIVAEAQKGRSSSAACIVGRVGGELGVEHVRGAIRHAMRMLVSEGHLVEVVRRTVQGGVRIYYVPAGMEDACG